MILIVHCPSMQTMKTFIHYFCFISHRSDFRHNFSPQFLHLYMLRAVESESQRRTIGDNTEFIQFRVAHVYQFILLIVASIYPVFHRKFSPILFIQTIIFVSFNKVVTAQYFLWSVNFIFYNKI